MAITRNFPVTTDISLLPEIANSLGAHLAAKLQGFASDERTLTDEFCDMICIWATHGHFMTAKSQSAGDTRASALCAINRNDLALISPFGRQIDKSGTNGILSDVFPLLRVTFVITSQMIERPGLPQSPVIRGT